jgi:hypothetical protein
MDNYGQISILVIYLPACFKEICYSVKLGCGQTIMLVLRDWEMFLSAADMP